MRALYAETAPRLMGLCLFILRDQSRSEKALRDAYVAIWRRAKEYDPLRGDAGHWLASIARREAIRQRDLSPERETLPRAVTPELAGDAIAQLPESSPLKRRFAKLQSDSAQALVLAYFYNLTHAQLADALNISPSAAGELVALGLAAIRD